MLINSVLNNTEKEWMIFDLISKSSFKEMISSESQKWFLMRPILI